MTMNSEVIKTAGYCDIRTIQEAKMKLKGIARQTPLIQVIIQLVVTFI